MIAYSFFTFLAALTAVYMLFLFRLRSGIRWLAGQPVEELPDAVSDAWPSVTVLLPVRNEEANILASIASLLQQRYPADRLDVLILDDGSEDRTRDLAEEAIATQQHFRLIRGEGEGKKTMLTAGVQAARGEVIVSTDADCMHDADWLRALVEPFLQGADIVAGPVVYQGRRSLFQRLQALEFLGLVGVGAGFFGIGFPRLCNGANFAYRKTQFHAVGGYEGNESIQSGDDEFLLYRIVYENGGQAHFVARPEAVVRTAPASTIGEFLRQRIRWASKSRSCEDRRFVSFLVLLFLYFLFVAFAPLMSITSLVAMLAGLLFFVLKVIADTAVLYAAAALFRQPLRIADVLLAEVLHAYYLVLVSLVGLFGRYTWKNRKVVTNRS
ncbi:MAG: glycosyltransferase [Bacteroidetes bacterium]|nr:glycosyltransferase [Bacteroidota bacterium]